MKEVKKKYLKWYEDMLLWRKFEDKLAALYIQQKVRGFSFIQRSRSGTSGCFARHGLDKG
jgi:TPP-dependent pyruvate/acetoin dehydrogenase alpha subunit